MKKLFTVAGLLVAGSSIGCDAPVGSGTDVLCWILSLIL